MFDMVFGVICAVFAVVCAVFARKTAKRKIGLVINPWAMMSKQERDREMAKFDEKGIKAEYRQQIVVFAGMAVVLVLMSVQSFTGWNWALYAALGFTALLLIYAIAASVESSRNRNRKG